MITRREDDFRRTAEALTHGFRELEKRRIAFQHHQAESAVCDAKIDTRIDKMLELRQIDAADIRSLPRLAVH